MFLQFHLLWFETCHFETCHFQTNGKINLQDISPTDEETSRQLASNPVLLSRIGPGVTTNDSMHYRHKALLVLLTAALVGHTLTTSPMHFTGIAGIYPLQYTMHGLDLASTMPNFEFEKTE